MTLQTRTTAERSVEPRWGGRRAYLWLTGFVVLALIVAMVLLPPLPEPKVFGGLADGRTLLGIPNFMNVVSNLPFLLVSVWGLHFLAQSHDSRGAFAHAVEKWPYACCFLGVGLTSIGSSYYHLAPDGARLVWDRLPMTIAFMSLLAAAIAERISVKIGLRLLVPLLAVGACSVFYWRWSALHAAEDLLPYAIVQYGSIAAIMVMAALLPSRYTRGADILVAGALYAAAKMAEVFDAGIYAVGGIVSGHTLKHLIAAVSIYWVLRMLRLRRAL